MADVTGPGLTGPGLTGPDLTGHVGAHANDDGSVPPAVADVLARCADGRADLRDVVAVLAEHRLLVPLLEVGPDQLGDDEGDPCAGADSAIAAVSVQQPDGTVAGLAFTGMVPLRAWRALARPLPTPGSQVAAAVIAGGGTALLVDPAGPHGCRLDGLALVRLAEAGVWPDPWADPMVRTAVVAVLGPALADGSLAVRLGPPPKGAPDAPGTPDAPDTPDSRGAPGPEQDGAAAPVLAVHLRFGSGISPEVAAGRARLVAERLGTAAEVRAVVSGDLVVLVDDQV